MTLSVYFDDATQRVDVGFVQNNYAMEVDLGVLGGIFGSRYSGSYEVTPTWEDVALKTGKQYLADDVRINAIPIYSVSNDRGGRTITIGG